MLQTVCGTHYYKNNIENVEQWTQETIKIFEDLVDIYIDKHKDTFEERTGNAPIKDKIIENLVRLKKRRRKKWQIYLMDLGN